MSIIRSVIEPTTGVVVAPTIVAMHKEFTPDVLTQKPPATYVVAVDEQFRVSTPGGLRDFPDVFVEIPAHVIPGVSLEHEAAADALLAWLEQTGEVDFLVVSTNGALLKRIRERNFKIRTGLQFTRGVSAREIREQVNSNLCRVAIVPAQFLSREVVDALQRRLVTVWGVVELSPEPAVVRHVRLLTIGVNGMVSNDSAAAHVALELFPPGDVVLARKPHIIGHRGTPPLAPENTLESAKLAYNHGSNMIENDIHITTDGVVMVHHDETLERTTTGTGKIEEHSSDELSQYFANTQFPEEYPNARIPRLAQYFEAFKELDVVHVVEIKSENERLIPALGDLINEYDVSDQVVVISFSPEQLRRFARRVPSVSRGFLTWGQVNHEPEESLLRVLHNIQPLSSTYNPNHMGIGSAYLEVAKHRGVTQWPWTYPDFETFATAFLAGTNGLTTNHSYWSESWLCELTAREHAVSVEVGECINLQATGRLYDRTESDVPVSVQIVSGDSVRVQDGALVAVQPGVSYCVLVATQEIDNARSYRILSEPITITVNS